MELTSSDEAKIIQNIEETIRDDALTQLILKLSWMIPVADFNGQNVFVQNHERIMQEIKKICGIDNSINVLRDTIEDVKKRGFEYAHLLESSALSAIATRGQLSQVNAAINLLNFGVKKKRIATVKQACDQLSCIAAKAIKDAAKIKLEHENLSKLLTEDAENAKKSANKLEAKAAIGGYVGITGLLSLVPLTVGTALTGGTLLIGASAVATGAMTAGFFAERTHTKIEKGMKHVGKIYDTARQTIDNDLKMWNGIHIAAENAGLKADELNMSTADEDYFFEFFKNSENVQKGFNGLIYALDYYIVFLYQEKMIPPTVDLKSIMSEEFIQQSLLKLQDKNSSSSSDNNNNNLLL